MDDDPEYIHLIHIQLERGGYSVDDISDPRNLLERYYKDLRPDCIILDVMMPGVDGFDVARAWRVAGNFGPSNDKRVPIIMHTALGGVQYNVDEAKRAGVDAYLTKPTDPYDLLQTGEKTT